MINTSEAYKEAIQGNCEFHISDKITFANKESLTLSMDDLMSYSIKEATSESGKFQVGAAVIKEYSVSIDNTEGKFTGRVFEEADILAVIGLKLADGTWEDLNKGTYRVVQAKESNQMIQIKAYDSMLFFDKPYSESTLVYPATIRQIVENACTDCGVMFDVSSIEMGNFTVQVRPSDDALTYRDVIGYCAQIMGCYARINHLDRLEFSWYSEERTHQVSDLISPTIDTDAITITGVRVIPVSQNNNEKNQVDSGAEGYMILLEENSLIQSEANAQIVSDHIAEKITGMAFRPYSVSVMPDPSIEAGDYAEITLGDGSIIKAPVTSTTFSFSSAQSIQCTAESVAEKKYVKYGAAAKIITKAHENAEASLSAYDLAVQNMNQLAANTFGFYSTAVKRDDGSIVAYRHDKPVLADSKVVYKSGIDGFFVTQDYQGTDEATTAAGKWKAGFDSGGNAVMNLLSVIGVNADYINVGALTVLDEDGNVIFQADISNKTVTISGDHVTVGNRNASEAIEEALNKASNAEENAAAARNMLLSISNEYQTIPVAADGSYTAFPECKTAATVMYGSADITAECSYTVSKSASVTGTWNTAARTYTVTALKEDTGWIDIKATYLNTLSVTKRFTVSKLYAGKTGADGIAGRTYFLESSSAILKRGTDKVIAPSSITFQAYYRDGASATRIAYAGRFIVEYTTNWSTWTKLYTSAVDETSVARSLRSLSNSAVAIRCSLYAEGGTSSLLDAQTVQILTDISALTHEEIFNLLTKNGTLKGIYKEGNQLYVSFTYAKGGTLTLGGNGNGNGRLIILNSNGAQVGYIDNTGVNFSTGTFSGSLNAASGTFKGTVKAGTVEGGTVSGATVIGSTVKSVDNYNSGITLTGGEEQFYWENRYFGKMRPDSDWIIDENTGAEKETQYLYFSCKIQAQDYIGSSDERLKDIVDWNDDYDNFLMELEPICYTWKEGEDKRIHTGFGAQTVKKLLQKFSMSSALVHGSEKKTYGLAYSEFHAMEIAVIQKNRKMIQELQKQILELQDELKQLKGGE